MSSIDIHMTSDTKDVVKAYARVIKQQDAMIARMKKGGGEVARSTAKAKRELKQFADQTKRINATPLERYTAQMMRLQKALASGLITQEQFNRASFRAEMQTASTASSTKMFGANMISLAGVITAGTLALRVWTTTMRNAREESDRIANRQLESEGGLAQLGQVAKGDTAKDKDKDLSHLINTAKQMFAGGVGSTLGEAADIVFRLRSASILEDSKGLFTELAGSKVVGDAKGFATALNTLEKNLGTAETGGIRALASKAFGASEFAPASAESLLLGASRGAQSAKTLGLSDEEILAATALTSESIGTAEEGGTAVASLLRSLVREAPDVFKGKSLKESIGIIKAEGFGEDELISFLGRQEAARAFGILSGAMESGEFDQVLGGVRSAEAGDEVAKRLGAVDRNPELNALRMQRQHAARNELAKRNRGIRAGFANALQDERQADLERRGLGLLGDFERGLGDFNRNMFGDRAFVRGMMPFAGGDVQQRAGRIGGELGIPEAQNQELGAMQKFMQFIVKGHQDAAAAIGIGAKDIKEAGEKINAAAGRQPPPGQVRQNLQAPVEGG